MVARRIIAPIEAPAAAPNAPLRSEGGDGTSDGMERRVTRLEEQMVGVREDLRDIKVELRSIKDVLPTLGTKRDLQTFTLTGIGLALAAIAIIATVVIGGLGWLETRASRVQPVAAAAPAPIVIQLPPYDSRAGVPAASPHRP